MAQAARGESQEAQAAAAVRMASTACVRGGAGDPSGVG